MLRLSTNSTSPTPTWTSDAVPDLPTFTSNGKLTVTESVGPDPLSLLTMRDHTCFGISFSPFGLCNVWFVFRAAGSRLEVLVSCQIGRGQFGWVCQGFEL